MSYPEAPFLSRTELPIQNTHTTGRSGGPGRRAGGRTTLQTSSNWRILKRPSTGPVTNVVNLRPKTTIFSEKAVGLTAFVTTDRESTRKTPWIDDVCNNTQKIGQKSQRARPLRYPRAAPQRPGTTGVEGTGGTGGYGCGVRGRRRVLAGLFTATRHHWCGGRRRDRRAWLRCPWAVAGPGRASRRRAERSSRRGRLAGGPPPTGTPSSPAQQGTPSSPAQQGTQSSPAQQAVGRDSARNTSGLRCNGVPTASLPGPS